MFLIAVVERTLVVVADAVVDVEFGGELPGVAGVEEPGVDEDLALGIANGDGGGGGRPARKSAERSDSRRGRRGWLEGELRRVGSMLAAVEGEGADGVALIELVKLGLAVFATEAELVSCR